MTLSRDTSRIETGFSTHSCTISVVALCGLMVNRRLVPGMWLVVGRTLTSFVRRLKFYVDSNKVHSPHMGQRDRDEESVVTVNFDEDVPHSKTGKQLSAKKLLQLSQARDKALISRRQKLKSRLEAKLSELRQILGPDNRPDIERVAAMMMKQEVTLRERQNALTLEVRDVINEVKSDLQALKERLLPKPSHSLSSLQHAKPRPRPVSEASSTLTTGSGRTITIAT